MHLYRIMTYIYVENIYNINMSKYTLLDFYSYKEKKNCFYFYIFLAVSFFFFNSSSNCI
ncbi:uncharacterized protein DS421_15g494000 [Arachis hypogaea]|nr:uncharacterized protein DS421_15g494000 [Arachis hypogaea]